MKSNLVRIAIGHDSPDKYVEGMFKMLNITDEETIRNKTAEFITKWTHFRMHGILQIVYILTPEGVKPYASLIYDDMTQNSYWQLAPEALEIINDIEELSHDDVREIYNQTSQQHDNMMEEEEYMKYAVSEKVLNKKVDEILSTIQSKEDYNNLPNEQKDLLFLFANS